MKRRLLQSLRFPDFPKGLKSDIKYEKITLVFSLILLVLVCGTGFWVYSKLSSVADDIAEGKAQDSRLLILKELNNDLVKAENFAFSYRITNADSLLTSFYLIRHQSGFKISQLRRIPSNYTLYKRHIDTLESLVSQKFVTLEDLVLVQNENRVNDAMDQVIHEVKSMSRAKIESPVKEPKTGDKKERRRLFQKRLEEKRQREEREAAAAARKNAMLSSASVNAGLQEIKKDVVEEEQFKNARKLIVEQRNNRLSARFTQLVQTIENEEKQVIMREAIQAKQVARETNIIIALFCLTSVLLILFTSYLLFLFLSKTKATTAQLIIAKQKSDQLTKSKSQFLANMSHELRTPLNAIVGFTDQLKQTELNTAQSNKVGIISKAADHLTRITNEILDFSKLSAGAVRMESIPFNFCEELDFVVTTLNQLAEEHKNKLIVKCHEEVPEVVIGDPMRVRQILINLVGNALKFTENGKVTIDVRPDLQSQKDTVLQIRVSDTGIGISEENLARIFEEFEQAEVSVARKFGGTGLGLSITRMLIERMNGSISVKSKEGKGTTFSFSLPFRIADNQPQSLEEKKDANLDFLDGFSVLVVDDEAYNRKLLRNLLEKAGVRITEASNGEEALEALGRAAYDLVLLDLRMPVMDGFATLKAVRKLPDMKTMPVVALSAAISQEERVSMVKDSWSGVLLKPFKVHDLASVIRKALNGKLEKTEVAEKQPEAAAEPEFSLQPLKELSGTDTAFYLDMLQTLARTTEEGLQHITENFAAKDYLAMAEAAHKIAAPVKHLNAAVLYEILKEIEIQGRSGETTPELKEKIETLQNGIEKILRSIEQEIAAV